MEDEATATFGQQLARLLTSNGEMLTAFTIVYSWIDEDGITHESWETHEDQLASITLDQLEMARLMLRQSITYLPDDDEDEGD